MIYKVFYRNLLLWKNCRVHLVYHYSTTTTTLVYVLFAPPSLPTSSFLNLLHINSVTLYQHHTGDHISILPSGQWVQMEHTSLTANTNINWSNYHIILQVRTYWWINSHGLCHLFIFVFPRLYPYNGYYTDAAAFRNIVLLTRSRV